MIDNDKAKQAFVNYVNSFDMGNDKTSHKLKHTFNVIKNSEYIAKKLNLSIEAIELAKLIALLHDIGRFYQAKEFNNFRDNETIDHAELGVKILFEKNMIREFITNNKYDEIIECAIRNHNKYEIDKDVKGENLLYTKIIRDADKIDILSSEANEDVYVLSNITREQIETSEISLKVYDSFKNKQTINRTDRKTALDIWISYIAFIFDINFIPSITLIEKNNYINKMFDKFYYKDKKVNYLKKIVEDYVNDKKIKELKKIMELGVNEIFPGATFGIITPQSINVDYVGFKSLPSEINNANTLYDLASLTKVIVTNTLIGFAIEEIRISLDAKLSDFIPEYSYLNEFNGIKCNILIKDLLTHQSALKVNNIKEELKELYKTNQKVACERCKQNLKDIKIDSNLIEIVDGKIQKKVSYANINFILLKEIIEKIYHKPFDELAEEKIFNPLVMKNTSFNKISNKDIDVSKYAPTEFSEYREQIRGYVHDENAFFLGGVSGNAGLFSDINDIAKYFQMVLNNGIINNQQYLSRDIIDLWFTPYNEKRTIGYEIYDNNIIMHTGFTGTSIFINRNLKIAVAILSNRIYYGRKNDKIYGFINEIYKLFSD